MGQKPKTLYHLQECMWLGKQVRIVRVLVWNAPYAICLNKKLNLENKPINDMRTGIFYRIVKSM